MSNKTKTYTYRPTQGASAMISSVAVILLLVVDFVYVSYANWHFRQLARLVNGDDNTALDRWFSQTDGIGQLADFSYVQIFVFIISVIFVAQWIYDSHCNARALGVQGIAYSPLLSVGSFFIPVASFFMPFIAMRDMVNGSFEKAGKPTFHWLILLWWICFIGGSAISRIYNRKADDLEKSLPDEPTVAQTIDYLEQLANILTFMQISSLLLLFSAIALIAIINKTSRLHHEMYRKAFEAAPSK